MMYLLPFLAHHGPGLTGAYAPSMVCCPVGAPPTITPQKPYITPGPGPTTADCGRATSRLPDSLPVPSTLPCSFISSTLHFTTDLQTLFLQRPPSIAWTSAPHCLNCPTRKFILASSSCFTVWTAAILRHPQPFSPPKTVYYLDVFWVVFQATQPTLSSWLLKLSPLSGPLSLTTHDASSPL